MGKKLAEKNTAKSALQQLLLPVYSALVAFQESSCAVTLSPYPCERNTPHTTPAARSTGAAVAVQEGSSSGLATATN